MDYSAESFKRACREGGRQIEAWLRSVDRDHGAAMYREAAAALKTWHGAEDAVQEAMVKVWKRCLTFQGQSQPLTWIRQIVRNTVLDHLAARRPETPLYDDDGELVPQAQRAVRDASMEAANSPEDFWRRAEVEGVFRECFARFEADHPDHAQVMRWVVEDGLGSGDIELLLDRTPGATREYISQCRKKARPYLAPWYALVKPGHDTPGGGKQGEST